MHAYKLVDTNTREQHPPHSRAKEARREVGACVRGLAAAVVAACVAVRR